MDLFRFLNPAAQTKLEHGQLIHGLTSIMWVERYREAGDFTIKGRIDSNLRSLLPLGTFISHVDTTDVMVVENHEISDNQDLNSEITITGRSYETFLENRIIGANYVFPKSHESFPAYFLLGQQLSQLIKYHIDPAFVYDQNDVIPYLTVVSTPPAEVTLFTKPYERGELYTQLLETLASRNLGLKTVRPGTGSPLGPSSSNTALVIHQGNDVSNTVNLSTGTGEIQGADYLWSNKNYKNCALITGKYLETMVKLSSSGYNRRVMYVDGSDIDGQYSSEPTGTDRDQVLYDMAILGNYLLNNQKEVILTNIEPTKNAVKYRYGFSYNMGDIIMVSGEYNESAKMRVTEYVRFEDKNGEIEYPTLSAI